MELKGPLKSYVSLMNEAIIKKAEHDKTRAAYYPLRPSSAGKCSRRLANELNEYKGNAPRTHEERKPNIHRLLSFGHTIEYHLIKYLEQIEGFSVRFKQQVVDMFPLPSGRVVEGSTDLVLWSEQHKCLMDVKSVGDRFYSAYETKWKGMVAKYDDLAARGLCQRIDEHGFWVPDVVPFLDALGEDSLADNIPQINLYLCTEFMQKREVSHGSVMRYLKNNSECFEIRFAPSMELYNKVHAKYSLVEQMVDAGTPEKTPRDFNLGSMACGFCPYKSKCWPSDDALKEYFKTWPRREWPERMENMPNKDKLVPMFEALLKDEFSVQYKATMEEKIIKAMVSEEVNKIKLDDGSIFEIVALKSPRPHFELRRVSK